MSLTFEVIGDKSEVFISGDPDGLRSLVTAVERLIANTADGQLDHTHLHTPGWAGTELSAGPCQGGDFTLANHVKIYCDKRSATLNQA